uniref:Uncharacterized protein n=2 Tax=Chrysotila carterae TaxID=13221 RepID=A0A7S4B369_CHRCT|mmetsp:Transcript_46224/g.100391  ORF Transcript_46224/g.100391 Transcript_46224/m.100391 type:complete len:110 (+) Transcript_46224:573-902(+)
MLVGIVLSAAALSAWFAVFIWYCTWMADEPERNRDGWFWFFGILTCLFLFVAAFDHLVLCLSFFKEMKSKSRKEEPVAALPQGKPANVSQPAGAPPGAPSKKEAGFNNV